VYLFCVLVNECFADGKKLSKDRKGNKIMNEIFTRHESDCDIS
jgi:hypothetical protein